MREVSLESRAEIDVPTPEFTEERLRILVVMCSEFTVFTGILSHRCKDYQFKNQIYEFFAGNRLLYPLK